VLGLSRQRPGTFNPHFHPNRLTQIVLTVFGATNRGGEAFDNRGASAIVTVCFVATAGFLQQLSID
jgi:hypothetical protein